MFMVRNKYLGLIVEYVFILNLFKNINVRNLLHINLTKLEIV